MIDKEKSRAFISNMYQNGTGPQIKVVTAATDGLLPPDSFARYINKDAIVFNEFWIGAYEKGFVVDGDSNLLAILGHESTHSAEYDYSDNKKCLAKFTGRGSDGTLLKLKDSHAARMFEYDTLGHAADLGLSVPYNTIKDKLLPLPK